MIDNLVLKLSLPKFKYLMVQILLCIVLEILKYLNKILQDVFYLPDFRYNLFSLAKLIKDLSCLVSFYPKLVIMQDLCSGRCGGSREAGGLYVFFIMNLSILYPL